MEYTLPRMEVGITNIKEVLNGIEVNPTYMYNCGSERSAVNFIIYDSHVQKYLVIGILKSWQVMMSMPFSLSAKHVCHISGQYSRDKATNNEPQYIEQQTDQALQS